MLETCLFVGLFYFLFFKKLVIHFGQKGCGEEMGKHNGTFTVILKHLVQARVCGCPCGLQCMCTRPATKMLIQAKQHFIQMFRERCVE